MPVETFPDQKRLREIAIQNGLGRNEIHRMRKIDLENWYSENYDRLVLDMNTAETENCEKSEQENHNAPMVVKDDGNVEVGTTTPEGCTRTCVVTCQEQYQGTTPTEEICRQILFFRQEFDQNIAAIESLKNVISECSQLERCETDAIYDTILKKKKQLLEYVSKSQDMKMCLQGMLVSKTKAIAMLDACPGSNNGTSHIRRMMAEKKNALVEIISSIVEMEERSNHI